MPKAGGKPAVGAETPREATIIARAIESLKPTHDAQKADVLLDGAKVGEALLKNPRARRELAEAMAI